jgi:hypothetical protein
MDPQKTAQSATIGILPPPPLYPTLLLRLHRKKIRNTTIDVKYLVPERLKEQIIRNKTIYHCPYIITLFYKFVPGCEFLQQCLPKNVPDTH